MGLIFIRGPLLFNRITICVFMIEPPVDITHITFYVHCLGSFGLFPCKRIANIFTISSSPRIGLAKCVIAMTNNV